MPPSFGDASVKGVAGLSSGGITTNVGKIASTLLAKHVRTLEVLHALQRNNADLRREVQERYGGDEMQQRIDEAVAAAIAAPNDLTEELRLQVDKLRERIAGLQEELAAEKKASAKVLDDASVQVEGLRALNQTLDKKCKDLEFEAKSQAQRTSLEGELQKQLREASVALALAEGRATDLAKRLADRESASCTLQLRLKEKEDKLHAMKTAEAVLLATAEESKARIADLERQVRGLQEKLEGTEAERGELGLQLHQASKELEKSREEIADRSTNEQELLRKEAEQASRANAAEAKLSEERKRFQRLREDAKRKLEEEVRRYKAVLIEYAHEREQLFERIDALSREIESLRAHMNNNRSQFSKYVEAKTENNQLKEELDGLREMIVVAPRPPNRSNSLGSGSSIAKSTLGGVVNKHISVERLRHSISVARGHHNNSATGNNYGGSNSSSTGNQGSTPVAFQGENYHQGNSTGVGGGKNVLVRRNSGSGHSTSSSGGGGWTGTSQAPSHKFSVGVAGSRSGRGVGEVGARGIRQAQQVF